MCLEGYVLCPPLCSSSVHVRHCYVDVQYLRSLSLSLSLSLTGLRLFECVALSVPIPFSVYIYIYISYPHTCTYVHTYTHTRKLFLSFSLTVSPSFVVSSSYWTPFFAPCCHTSMPLPAIRNVAAALPRYLRDVSYTAPPTRMVPPACLPACLPACVRPGRKSMLDGFACSMHMHF